MMKKKFTYRKAGVDIEQAERSLEDVKLLITETHNKRVIRDIGAFGSFYALPVRDYRKPVLVSSTDGVGTKLKVAMMMNKHDTVGQDLVNHCINDIAVCGAKPLYFLDYFGCGKLHKRKFTDIIKGLTAACKEANIPLVGGETAEMPDIYHAAEYDLVGTIIGIVDRKNIVDGRKIKAGDVLIGVQSNGLHTNGYSLARKVIFTRYSVKDYLEEIGNTIGEELLKVHLNYYPVIKAVSKKFPVKGMVHVTGGGLYKNTIRILPEGLKPRFDWNAWNIPPIFELIRSTGHVPRKDMRQTFNLGIGLIFIINQKHLTHLLSYADQFKQDFYHVGEVVPEEK